MYMVLRTRFGLGVGGERRRNEGRRGASGRLGVSLGGLVNGCLRCLVCESGLRGRQFVCLSGLAGQSLGRLYSCLWGVLRGDMRGCRAWSVLG